MQLGKELLAEQDLDQVLKASIDKLIVISGAERGFVVLFDEDGENLIQTARKLQKSDIEKPAFEVSRTIIERVKSERAPVFLRNAMEEEFFDRSLSVDVLKILSVICLPLADQQRVFGVIYLDNRTVLGAFTPETYQVVMNFADFISLAARHALELSRFRKQNFELEKQLRDGYNTRVGPLGHQLSAGQVQRIGLARAVFDMPFLVILDEPNAHLDAEGEMLLNKTIAALRANGSIVMVAAHRKSALAATNKALLLVGGEVKMCGDRDTVLNQLPKKQPATNGGLRVVGS